MRNLLTVRKARRSDVDLIYNWSNDLLVREQSYTSSKITYETHCAWYNDRLEDKKSLVLIMELKGVPVSIVRFEIDREMTTIGISIDKEYRGKGIAATAIRAGVDEYFREYDLPVVASINRKNIASIKSFERAGFSFFKEEDVNSVGSVVYRLRKR